MSAAAILVRAAELLSPAGSWTQGCTARDSSGCPVHFASDNDAACWCAGGAIHRASHEITGAEDGEAAEAAVIAVATFAGVPVGTPEQALEWLIEWSDEDGRLQFEVLQLFRDASWSAPGEWALYVAATGCLKLAPIGALDGSWARQSFRVFDFRDGAAAQAAKPWIYNAAGADERVPGMTGDHASAMDQLCAWADKLYLAFAGHLEPQSFKYFRRRMP